MKKIILLCLLLLVSCREGINTEDMSKLKIGMTKEEVEFTLKAKRANHEAYFPSTIRREYCPYGDFRRSACFTFIFTRENILLNWGD